MASNIVHPLQNVLVRINQAAKQGEHNATNTRLVAVSKTRPIEDIVTAYEAGVRHFGENRTKELVEKATALSHLPDIQWHFIGHLQTRQSNLVAQYAHYFHAVDRIKIAKQLSTQLHKFERTLPVFIEVNISGEESKAGFNCANWENAQEQRNTFCHAFQSIAILPSIQIRGLMTMAPRNASQNTVRNIFSRLRHLSKWLNHNFTDFEMTELSMGMSGDFEIAVEEGATYVRVGSAIFGK